ncbi:spore germination protein GerKA [Desulfocucumis palustris]|uniref:Spore germination protein GerKA n=1 Tax=Desulfocucumis palustris TaxID=1898651 RepID=A0A2L2XE89_9FIRM|nr:spore germination protein [Desulfocucumis palustris]GBF34545.1 spore germination protein GerKA [Desulfocucumis palustris]
MVTRLLKRLARKPSKKRNAGQAANGHQQPEPDRRVYLDRELKQMAVMSRLEDNLNLMKNIFGLNNDVVFRHFRLGAAEQTGAAVVYVDGMTDNASFNNDIMKPLMLESRQAGFRPAPGSLLEWLQNSAIPVSNVFETGNMENVVSSMLYGNVILFIDGQDKALVLDIKNWNSRQVSEPDSEILVRGPREGFVETLRTNTSLIRRRLRSPNLILENIHIGRVSHTGVTIAYIRGIVSPDMVAEVKRRLQRINIDGVLESGYLEEFIEDNPYSPFPQIIHTERPDRVAASLLEGRVAILTDGTPVVLIVPVDITAFMSSAEDYYERYMMGTIILWLRFVAFGISILLPSLYIAITTFHQEMIPTRLLITLAAAREGVPFPALVEALLMEFTFEALREAGVRLPRSVGQAVSIVGALVIGQAAVQAGIVSPLMVIVVAVTGIASFASPAFNFGLALRLLRFPMMLLAASLGLFGVMVGILAILIHLAGLRSFGVPYLSPLAPLHPRDLKDVLMRVPWWAMDERPAETAKQNRRRQAPGLKPSVKKPGGEQGDRQE